MSVGSRLIKFLSATNGGDVSATNTPALDDNTKKISTTEFLFNQFTGSGKRLAATSGYQVLPGGIIIQWGSTGIITSGSNASVTFPKVFPNACLQATGTGGAAANISAHHTAMFGSISTTGMVVFGFGINAAVSWIAIGY